MQFKKDQYKTVGVTDTRHMLLSEGMELLTMHHEPSKADYHVLFSLKRRVWGGVGLGTGTKNDFLIKTVRLPKIFLTMSRILTF